MERREGIAKQGLPGEYFQLTGDIFLSDNKAVIWRICTLTICLRIILLLFLLYNTFNDTEGDSICNSKPLEYTTIVLVSHFWL